MDVEDMLAEMARALVDADEVLARMMAGARTNAGGAAAPPHSLGDVHGLGRPHMLGKGKGRSSLVTKDEDIGASKR